MIHDVSRAAISTSLQRCTKCGGFGLGRISTCPVSHLSDVMIRKTEVLLFDLVKREREKSNYALLASYGTHLVDFPSINPPPRIASLLLPKVHGT